MRFKPSLPLIKHLAGAIFTLGMFGLALYALHYALKGYTLREIFDHFESIPPRSVAIAAGLTILSYITLTGYEIMGLMMVNAKMPYRIAALASFISYAFSNNIGFSLITGASVRYRIYAARNLSAVDIAYVATFCVISFGLGAIFIVAIAALIDPDLITHGLHLPVGIIKPVALVTLVLWSAWIMAGAIWTGKFRFFSWEIRLPKARYTIAQTVLAVCDIGLAAGVLYIILPPEIRPPFLPYLGVYVIAIALGVVSHVPSGIGVFESLMVFMLPDVPKAALLGSIIAYRCIYFILPLALAAVLTLGQEVVVRNLDFSRLLRSMTGWIPKLSPQISGTLVMLCGAILLFSGAYPSIGTRLSFLEDVLPLSVLEISHVMNAVTGFSLLILSRGLYRRLDAAYHLTVIGLMAGIFFSLLKGIDFEEAAVLALVLAILIPSRAAYYRKASLFSSPFTPQWLVPITIVLASSIWFGFFSYKHVEYTSDLWWHFAFHKGGAPRFLRATLVLVSLGFSFALYNLLRPMPPRPRQPREEDLHRVRSILATSPVGSANLALLGDKKFLFSDNGTAFIMYAVHGRTWVALGDPVGPAIEHPDLAWKFRELCDIYDGRPIFYQADAKHLSLYLDLGLRFLKLGEEARVPLQHVAKSMDRPDRKDFRYAMKRATREGASFEVVAPADVTVLLPELKAISDQWLSNKNTKEKGFSIGIFDQRYLKNFPIALVRSNGKPVAFASLFTSAEKEEISVDLMRYTDDAPYGVMDYLFAEIMLWGEAQEYQWLNLGVAPLSGFEEKALASTWHKLGTFFSEHGDKFYNFEGLRRYKAKFSPEWRPKYLAFSNSLALPRILLDVSSLVSGGVKGIVTK